MKSKLQVSAAILLFSLGVALAQPTAPTPSVAPAIDPTTGLPIRNRAGTSQPQMLVMVDPQTGNPIAPSQPDWKDPNWKDPDIVLTNVNFEGLPIAEIAALIRDQFKGQFDVILPNPTSGEYINRLTGARLLAPTPGVVNQETSIDWRSETTLNLRLKDVTASELFNAMNLIFENDKTPLQWELKVNGHRQLALLRVLVDPAPHDAPQPPPEPLRRIYFVGDLIGDEKNGGMTMDQIVKTITDVWQMADTANGRIQFHNEAQLLVVTGTPDEIQFVEQTLSALERKVELTRHSLKMSDAKPKADESKK